MPEVARSEPRPPGPPGPPRRFPPAWLSAVRARITPLIPALRALGFVLAVALVAWMGVRAAQEVDLGAVAWWPLPFALAAAGGWWLLLARGWGIVAAGRPSRGDVSIWCRTQAVRYLPGGFWAPASRVAVLKGRMADRVSTVAAENVIALCAALAVGAGGLTLAGNVWALPAVLVAAAPVLGARALEGRTRVAPDRARRATGNYLVAFAAYAVSAVLVQLAVSGAHDVALVAGAAALAWAAGLVVVIAPGGVGVREVVYVWILASAFPDAELAAAAVTSRVVVIVAELAVLVVAGRPPAAAPAPRAVRG